jgi:hypothetical protein
MRWTVVIPGALLPSPIAAEVMAGAATPWLGRALGRAQIEPPAAGSTRGAPHVAWLWRQFGGSGEPVTAPYALRALAADADCGAQCWHIDPVHFAFARDHLLVTALDDSAPDEAETGVLARHLEAALAEFAATAGPRLHLHGGRWLLALAAPWRLQTTALDDALGRPAHLHMPEGADAALWRKLLNEVQIRWHQEELNEKREARGRRAVNALWLHGGGAWLRLPARPFATVVGHDPALRGWALASGLSAEALHDDDALPAARGDAVSIRRDLLAPAQFEAWGQWLQRLAELESALRALHDACFAAGYDELTLVLGGRQSVRIARLRRGDAWRVWRRAPLAPLLAEAQ